MNQIDFDLRQDNEIIEEYKKRLKDIISKNDHTIKDIERFNERINGFKNNITSLPKSRQHMAQIVIDGFSKFSDILDEHYQKLLEISDTLKECDSKVSEAEHFSKLFISPNNIDNAVITNKLDSVENDLDYAEEYIKIVNKSIKEYTESVDSTIKSYVLEKVTKKSVSENKTKIKRYGFKRNISIKHIKTASIAIASLTAALVIAKPALDNLSDSKKVTEVHESIVTMAGNENNQGIVASNTHRTDDYQNYWFDNASIAKEILSLPDDIFDAALYDVYNEMGSDKTNNIDDLIRFLSIMASNETNPNAYSKLEDCKTFNDYLIKNNYVDEKGNPDVNKFREYSRSFDKENLDEIKNLSGGR